MRVLTRKLFAKFGKEITKSSLLEELDRKALKAMWAEHFFTEILNPKQNDKILVDNLISLKLPDGANSHFVKPGTSR
jgi:hypothetical protein